MSDSMYLLNTVQALARRVSGIERVLHIPDAGNEYDIQENPKDEKLQEALESAHYADQAMKSLWEAIRSIDEAMNAWKNDEKESEETIEIIQEIIAPFFNEPDV